MSSPRIWLSRWYLFLAGAALVTCWPHVGLLAALIGRTNHEAILALDCLATDFWHTPAWPTKLVYNPYADTRTVELSVGDAPVDAYDTVGQRYLAKATRGTARFELASEQAAVVVLLPAGTALEPQANGLSAGGRMLWCQKPAGR